MPRQGERSSLPRGGFPLDYDRQTATEFARSAGLAVAIVEVERYDELIPWLLEGKGDVIAASLTATAERRARVAFTVPLDHVKEVLVTRADDLALAGTKRLAGRTITIRQSSSFWATCEALAKRTKGLTCAAAAEGTETEDLLEQVAEARIDLTIADDNLLDAVATYRKDLRPAFDLTPLRPTGWAVRPAAPELKAALDRFLNEAQLERREQQVYADDLPGIRKRRVLRVLTRNSAATYFTWKGELLGFEYELASEFARRHGLALQIVVPPTREDLLRWLADGKGDIVAAGMTPTDERQKKFAFSRSYAYASQVVVARANDPKKPAAIADLADRKLFVRPSSSYWSSLGGLIGQGAAFEVIPAPEDMETEELIAGVAAGRFDLTVADSPILDIELTYRDDVEAAFELGKPLPQGWVVRKKDKQLLAAIDSFFVEEYRGVHYNLHYRKYFKDARVIREAAAARTDRSGVISPYDDLVRAQSAKYGIDWRLVAAQMYQESRFDPNATSWVGAIGLMQVMPRTGKEMGFTDLAKPENGVEAGVKYLAHLRDKFEADLPVTDRMWFALASYNAGAGHVADARVLARQKKLDPDRWFGNVELAMALLAKPEFARKARFGYCRGEEPVKYVREIRDRYDAYVRVAPSDTTGLAAGAK